MLCCCSSPRHLFLFRAKRVKWHPRAMSFIMTWFRRDMDKWRRVLGEGRVGGFEQQIIATSSFLIVPSMDGRNIPVYLHLHSLQSPPSTISTLLWAPLTNWLTICTGCRVTWISVLIIWFPFVNLFTALFNCNWGLGLRLKVNHVHFTLVVGWLVGQWNAVYSQCRDEEADERERNEYFSRRSTFGELSRTKTFCWR